MQHVITISLDKELLDDIDEDLKTSTFNGRSQLVSYLLHRHLHQRRLNKYKDLILYITILLGFALILMILVIR